MSKATIKDVAKLAGVSISSVSNVINGINKCSEETRLKVLEEMDKTLEKLRNLEFKIKDYENVGSSSDNTHGNVHFEKGETKTITLYYLITDEEFENETLAIDFHYYGSPCKGTLAIVHEPETN